MDEKVELSLTLKLFNITKAELAREMGYSFSQVVCAFTGSRMASKRFWETASEACVRLLQKKRLEIEEKAKLSFEEYSQALSEINDHSQKLSDGAKR